MSLFNPSFSCGAKLGDVIYASSYLINALVKIQIDSGRTVFISQFPESEAIIENQHSRAYTYNGKVFFCPAFGNYIHIFDSTTNEIRALVIDRQKYNGEFYGLMNKEKLILYPKNSGGDFLSIDMNSMEISVLLRWKQIEKYIPDTQKNVFLRIILINDKMYLPVYNSSTILTLDLNTLAVEKKDVEVEHLLGAFGGEDEIVLLSNNNSFVYKWCPPNNKVEQYTKNEALDEEISFTFVIELKERKYFFPGYSSAYIGNDQDNKINLILHLECMEGKLLFLEPFCCENKIWALPFQGDELICISDNSIEKIKLFEIEMNMSDRNIFIQRKLHSGGIMTEGVHFLLEEYVQGIIKEKRMQNER